MVCKKYGEGEKAMKKNDLAGVVTYILLVALGGVLCSLGLDNVHPEDWFV